jgi:hypothetical protein
VVVIVKDLYEDGTGGLLYLGRHFVGKHEFLYLFHERVFRGDVTGTYAIQRVDDTMFHLGCSLVGKGDSQDGTKRYTAK